MRTFICATSVLLALFLTACGTTQSSQSNPANPPVSQLLNAKGKWQSLGKISNGNMEVSYDTGSLHVTQGIIQIRSRTVVRDMEKENFINTPDYKTAVGEWEMVCAKQTYRLQSMSFFDVKRNVLAQHSYTHQQTPPMPIQPNSPAKALFDVACGKTNQTESP